MNERKLFRKQDIYLIAVLLILALIAYGVYAAMNRGLGNVYCVIFYNGEQVQTVELTENSIFEFEKNGNVRFEVRDNAMAFIESDCPDKVCVRSGYLNRPGQMAACLPNRVSIRIMSGANDSDIDMIAG